MIPAARHPARPFAFRSAWRWLLACGIFVRLLARFTSAAEPTAPGPDHWAFRPITRGPSPASTSRTNAAPTADSPVDRLIDARLRAEGLEPAPPADRATLIRRAAFDLTGLPPSPEEVDTFVTDPAPDAFARLVDRLLASPRYGERWGRHWMDVVRYADTAGDNADYPVPELHLYRDYLIDAFEHDKPYDRFVQEQLAGDVLAREQPTGNYAEGIIATGFLALSRRYGTGPFELWHLTLENTIETVGQAFLGLNLKCARCHDHKFDPLTMRDYYGLYGIFGSTEFPWAGSEEIQSKQFNRQKFVPLLPDDVAKPKWDAWQRRLSELRERMADIEKESPTGKGGTDDKNRRLAEIRGELRTLEKPGAPPDLPVAYAVREGRPADAPLQRRGEPASEGETVPRCVPAVLAGTGGFKPATNSSGRLEFAHWLTRPENPLTARVMVNRIWQHHFGAGLVSTPNNLGQRSDPPAHRELLDYLAARFIEGGWSVKAMHRQIMNSAAYQRSSRDVPASRERDPANRLLWRQTRTRLDAESIRDALLHVGGELDLSRPDRHPFPGPEQWTWTQHTPFKERYESRHRSVYLMTQRFQKHPFLALFDGPDTNSSTEARRVSTVPQQALFELNNRFMDERSLALARRVLREANADRPRLARMVGLAWSRPPAPSELARLEGWLEQARTAMRADTPTAPPPVPESTPYAAWVSLARVLLTANEFHHVD